MRTTIPPALLQRLLLILQRGFVEARNLALGEACHQLRDLADTFEILPTLMDDWEHAHLERIRRILRDYQEKYPGTAYDYLSILDMSDASFSEVFGAREAF